MTLYELKDYVDTVLLLNINHSVYFKDNFNFISALIIKNGNIHFLNQPSYAAGKVYWSDKQIEIYNLNEWFMFPIKIITKDDVRDHFK